MPSAASPSVALVHERFTEWAGSEMVVEQLAHEFPEALVHAPVADPANVPAELRPRLRPGRLSRLLRPGGGYAHLLPALPVAMARTRLPDVDVVVASHHAFASQVVHATDAPVVAYVHSPARWVWDREMRRGEVGGAAGEALLGAFSAAFRPADHRAAQRLRTVVANSTAVADRVRRWWDRDAVVVHPPVDVDSYTPDASVGREDFYLLAGRLVPYKRPELAVRAATAAGVPLVVAGDGRARADCERVAGPNVRFLGRTTDAEQLDLYRRCKALLMPGVEDFGIVPVEAQACGAPVVAAAEGGALDTVLPGRTGVLVPEDGDGEHAVARWAEALASTTGDFDPGAIRTHAEGFSRAHFRERMREVVLAAL
ncbi:glycosyltransferase [Pseudokineococcus lusitanus]|uniref:Glycosyltransferase involved in cell wall biosynthesis n=1 Tax=Pseudokineococcus lusitanus TaxID=763993 RepID=A0A3N1HMF8_9ACTN|nr:glycosyltransferase [Pseudokineococcus lusitanus]ROP43694.1 glycosyltransferase involved in cell wall biosynthesis [Pseudokineococcus lusitanus]